MDHGESSRWMGAVDFRDLALSAAASSSDCRTGAGLAKTGACVAAVVADDAA